MAASTVVRLDLLRTCLRQQLRSLPCSASSSSPPSSFFLPSYSNPPIRLTQSVENRVFRRRNSSWTCLASGSHSQDGEEEEENEEEVQFSGVIPPSADEFLKQVSSRAYDARRQLEQTMESSSYDVLEANPFWRENSKSVYVLALEENKLFTMRTRRARSEVEKELGLLFPKRGSRRGKNGLPTTNPPQSSEQTSSSTDTCFPMLVEDVREGVLVFEDEETATQYCRILDGEGKNCMGVAELEASDVFALCKNMNALVVLFRRGRTPPLPDRLQLYLKARRRSLED